MRFPCAIPAIALAAGVSAGIFLPVVPSFSILVGCWFSAAVALACRFDRGVITALAAGFFIAGVIMGAHAHSAAVHTPVGLLFERSVGHDGHQLFATLEGRLRTDASPGRAGASLNLEVLRLQIDGRWHTTRGGVLVGVGGSLAANQISEWRAGRHVRMPAILRRPSIYLNPGTADARRQLAWRGTTLVASAKSDRLVEVVRRGSVFTETAAEIRFAVRAAVSAAVARWSERSAAIVTAILIGDRAGLDDEVERRLQEAGTYHVIAISGGNIAIFAGLCAAILRASRTGPRSTALVIVMALAGYAAIVEGGSSVGRATLMAAIYFAARIWDHRAASGNVAALAAAILFCIDPLQIVDAGFALTFGATLGILIGMSRFTGLMTLSWWIRPAALLLAATVFAEIVLAPISALVFSRVTAAGLAVNFAAIPLMTVVQVAGMTTVAAAWLGWNSAFWSGWVAHQAVNGLIGSAALVDAMPWLTRRVPPPSLALMSGYYVAVVAAVTTRAVTSRVAAAVAALFGVWIVAAPDMAPRRPELLRVSYFDVGQGDAAVVQFPAGRTLSVDAGGLAGTSFDIGSRVVSPALWAAGVRRIDYMTISHGDPDHIGGAASVFRDFHPAEVWEGIPVPPHEPTRRLRALANSAGTPWRTVMTGDRVGFGDVRLNIHHPPIPDWERQRVRNNDSAVLELLYGGVSFVFAGDIGREVEREIAPSFEQVPIRVLKVPHHGSATSSSTEFLDALRPTIAVISCGRGNPFGHPVPAVVDRYRASGAAIYRTDQDGAVTVETDGTTLRVRTFSNRRLTLRAH